MVSFVQSPLKKNYFGLTFRIRKSVHRTYSVEGGLYQFHFDGRKSPSSGESPAILNNKYFALKKSANYFLCPFVFFKNIQTVNFLTLQIILKM